MTSLLARALRAVSERSQSNDVGGSVVRVDVRRDGALDLCLAPPGPGGQERRLWFRFSADRLDGFEPSMDDAIPLSRELERRYGTAWSVLAYRPGRRLVVGVTEGGRPCVAKGYRKRRSATAAQNHAIAARINNGSAFRVPQLIREDTSHAALLFERFEGEPVRIDLPGAPRFFSIGVALRRFQEVGCDDGTRLFTAADELAVLDRWARAHETAAGDIPGRWIEIRDQALALQGELPQSMDSLCHRDLHDGQLLASERGIALLDYDLLCRADVALDPANLLAHLSLRAMQGLRGASDDGALACGEAFVDGLGWENDAEFWARLRFYEATSFLRLALIYALRPRWRHLQGQLTELAGLCLGEFSRVGGG